MAQGTVSGAGGRVGVVHVHTAWSHDGRDTLEDLHDLCRRRGIRFVGLTDHAEDFDQPRFEDLCEACAVASSPEVALIPGLEYRFAGHKGLHLLALGMSAWMAPATPAEFIAEARRVARFTIAAHPVLYRYDLPAAVAEGIDAIEIWNAGYNTRWLPDPRAMDLLTRVRATRPEVRGIAGLDQHDARNDREVRVRLTDPDPARDPLLELKAGRFENVGRTMTLRPDVPLSPAGLRLLRTVRWGFDRIERSQEKLLRFLRKGVE